MSETTTAMTSSASVYTTSGFWERLWRTAGLQFVGFFVIAYLIYGNQPQVGAPADALVGFYHGERMRILIAAVFSGLNVLNLMWFAAALKATLADAGQDGWGAAVTASSAALGGLFLLMITVSAALAYAITGSGNDALTSGLNDLLWVCVVLSSFPRAMLIMAGTFGLWRAGLISNARFAAGVAALLLVLLGGTTWVNGGFWAADGAYSRFVSPLIGLVWIVVVSRVILSRPPATRAAW
jgi:ABC-type multidrug transport system permease subunit